jgi:diguanylate cyclase (GGDEF)-like protein
LCVVNYPFAANRVLYNSVFPWLGIVFSLASFFAGHFSYPRVHNLKVYLAGYLSCVFGIAFFVLYRFALPGFSGRAAEGYRISLYVLMAINCAAIICIKSYSKYRTVRQITLIWVTVESVLIVIARLSPQATDWLMGLSYSDAWDVRFFVELLAFLVILGLSVALVNREFYLGGLLAGWAFFFVPAWMSRQFLHGGGSLETMLFCVMPLYLTAGVLIHWFLRMEHRIAYDPLLHIYNRDYCSRIIAEQSNLDSSPPFSIAMVDIDHFKNVNDTHGHQAGDMVLYAVAQAICREVVPEGIVCRYGGEELIIFFPQKTVKEAAPLVEGVRKGIEKLKIKTRKKTLGVTVSCGISCREELVQPIIDVIHAADKAMYKAKKEGRNQVRLSKTACDQPKKKPT